MSNIKRNLLVSIVATIVFSSNYAMADFKGLPVADRISDDEIELKWDDANPVDIYGIDKASDTIKTASILETNIKGGSLKIKLKKGDIKYFILKDAKDGEVLKIGERLIPLDTGSNFRDIGGYKGFNGKSVKWGMIYRSGATPLLSQYDLMTIKRLGLKGMIDLRSDEERVIAPSKMDGIKYTAYNYSFMAMLPKTEAGKTSAVKNSADLYRNFPYFLKPQLKEVFTQLLQSQTPLEYNCSAGQDRTGFVTAMVLSALGVDRDTIYRDYKLSTAYRKPENEMAEISPDLAKSNPVAGFFAQYRNNPTALKPQPLWEADGTPFLTGAFAEIDSKWGSVDNYLKQEIGLTDNEIAKLRALYLE